MITRAINDQQLIELPGNLRSEAIAANDRGLVADSLVLSHMQLLLMRPVATETALKKLIDQLHDPNSPQFHQWLTTAQLRAQFGPAASDLSTITNWLSSKGFAVNGVQNGGLIIDFTGTAAQVREAFHTEIHRLDVNGAAHIANMSNPRIPGALAGVVHGIVSLNDFRPHTNYKPKPAYTFTSDGNTFQAVVPADLATIYNLSPLFEAGITGEGQTIVVIEDSNVYSTADWKMFRWVFGLAGHTTGSLTQAHPAPASGPNNCVDPGVLAGDESEAELDAEWASAAAPGAAIVLASCQDTPTTFGGLIALENLLDSETVPAIVSISYGECEAENGATANAVFNTVYEQAVALGTSVFVAAGDEGAASCDAGQTEATHGIGVSGYASTPYNVAVGGTDFGDTYAGTAAEYWKATNSPTYGSALSYVPEIPWNNSCASSLLSSYFGYSAPYGESGFCNSSTGESEFLTTASGSGGPSGCATGAPATQGVVSGTCAGYPKPSWQAGLPGISNDGVRDLPDVSLFAANGVWGHYYVFCDSDQGDQGAPCSGAPSGWSGGGGTSFATPIMAGFQALVNQKTGSRQGNPNTVYYPLAAKEYGPTGSTSCNSSNGSTVGSACLFYDVTLGDNDVNCTGDNDCYDSSGDVGPPKPWPGRGGSGRGFGRTNNNGVLSTSTSSYSVAYGTGVGWDFATGIGSVNIANLVNSW